MLTREQVIEIAKEAGINLDNQDNYVMMGYTMPISFLESAMNLAYQAGALAERENIKILPEHEVADAFWNHWKENGETHKHGYYESTWGAINAALKCAAAIRNRGVV